jgi:CRP/FNR family nitrogen fixation transcriptional regulator
MLNQTSIRPVPPVKMRRNLPARGAFGAIELAGSHLRFGSNQEIFGEDEPAEYVYKVVGGAVRNYRIMTDGRRQIGAFYLPGDIFGLENGRKYRFSAEAIGNTSVRFVKRSAIVALTERDYEAARELWIFTTRELHRVQEHMLLLVMSAQQRVACFLLEMSDRLAASDAVEFPMSRQDIADYLGLTIETVSRTMSHLVSDAVITLPTPRCVVLRNRRALRQLSCRSAASPFRSK